MCCINLQSSVSVCHWLQKAVYLSFVFGYHCAEYSWDFWFFPMNFRSRWWLYQTLWLDDAVFKPCWWHNHQSIHCTCWYLTLSCRSQHAHARSTEVQHCTFSARKVPSAAWCSQTCSGDWSWVSLYEFKKIYKCTWVCSWILMLRVI